MLPSGFRDSTKRSPGLIRRACRANPMCAAMKAQTGQGYWSVAMEKIGTGEAGIEVSPAGMAVATLRFSTKSTA